jgi:hypothetical protein
MSFEGTRFQLRSKEPLYITQEVLDSEPILRNTSPAVIQVARARELVNMFMQSKVSEHSGRGSTLWVLVEYCKHNKIDYCLTGTPSEGYIIECLYA